MDILHNFLCILYITVKQIFNNSWDIYCIFVTLWILRLSMHTICRGSALTWWKGVVFIFHLFRQCSDLLIHLFLPRLDKRTWKIITARHHSEDLCVLQNSLWRLSIHQSRRNLRLTSCHVPPSAYTAETGSLCCTPDQELISVQPSLPATWVRGRGVSVTATPLSLFHN